jgi:hypothetical protein
MRLDINYNALQNKQNLLCYCPKNENHDLY